jgi:CRISPR/Cas system CSM-associated protein Csm3 (group 7 of RAMP superfamily)
MEGEQSLLIVEDALAGAPQVELRDGVSLDATTRTAEEGKLFDMEVLRAGTLFPVRFELLIPAGDEDRRERLCRDLALALQGFGDEEIGLGARKRRGLGRCRLKELRVWRYDLTGPEGLLAWLARDREDEGWDEYRERVPEATGQTLAQKLGVGPAELPDARERFELRARFALDGSLLVRSGAGESNQGPDAVHLHRTPYDDGSGKATAVPVLPGTSLAGALRARARRIAKTLTDDQLRVQALIFGMFGAGPVEVAERRDEQAHRASRLVVHEAVLKGANSLVQTRIRVDRFTGGAMDNYLFSETPVFGGEGNQVELELLLRQPRPYEIGLLLLLLKDLWTDDLPLGGESGIGRGRLSGQWARLIRMQDGEPSSWTIDQTGTGLELSGGPREELESFVADLHDYLAGRYVEDDTA